MRKTVSIVFSKDRALQLEGVIHSLLLNGTDIHKMSDLKILYTTSNKTHKTQYEDLISEYSNYSFIEFVKEQTFKTDLLNLLKNYENVLFLVDDNIFVESFKFSDLIRVMDIETKALVYSLRLSPNTTYCYMLDKAQPIPLFDESEKSLVFDWTKSEYDFGYPMDVSSSLYRVKEILPYLSKLPFKNPNSLEALMDENKNEFHTSHPKILCGKKSFTFCTPVNKVQDVAKKNRAGIDKKQTPEYLAKSFNSGKRLNVEVYKHFIPNACHQEVTLHLYTLSSKVKHSSLQKILYHFKNYKHYSKLKNIKPNISPRLIVNPFRDIPSAPLKRKASDKLVSIVIPCFNQAKFLKEAVQSVVNQNYTNWECIIINDGSHDNTSEVAKHLIDEFSNYDIQLMDTPNGGPSIARNKGIQKSKGDYILPLDSDDILLPNAIERFVHELESDPKISFVYCDRQDFGASNEFIRAMNFNASILYRRNILSYCSIFKKQLWVDIGGYDPIPFFYEDWNFWISAVKYGHLGKHIQGSLFHYRIKEQSAFTEAVSRDAEFKAHIVLNHRELYDKKIVAWAERELDKHHISGSLVSVIFTIHNDIHAAKKAFYNLFNQTYRSIEILIVCNNDEWFNEVNKLNSPFPLTHIKEKSLQSIIRNNCNGKFITYINEYDLLYKTHIQNLATHLEKKSVDVSVIEPIYNNTPWLNSFQRPLSTIMHTKSCTDHTKNEEPLEKILYGLNTTHIPKYTLECYQNISPNIKQIENHLVSLPL